MAIGKDLYILLYICLAWLWVASLLRLIRTLPYLALECRLHFLELVLPVAYVDSGSISELARLLKWQFCSKDLFGTTLAYDTDSQCT